MPLLRSVSGSVCAFPSSMRGNLSQGPPPSVRAAGSSTVMFGSVPSPRRSHVNCLVLGSEPFSTTTSSVAL